MNTIEIVHGTTKAVFKQTEQGWTPDWFYEGERPMLRFKDHEWLSLGHVRPTAAEFAEELADGAVFRGTSYYGRTAVAWSIVVRKDARSEGFVVECAFRPEAPIELLEAYSTFETPYEYDGSETVTTVIGMNPVVRWKGAQRITPPIWENPAWVYSRPQAARITAPCNTPYLCQAITEAGPIPDRFVTLIGDWSVCNVHDVYVTPTRNVAGDPASAWGRKTERKGYKYIVGALNWSSAFAKDPNVLYEGGKEHRQRVIVSFSTAMPGGSLDAMLYRAWERTALLDIPKDGNVKAYQRAAKHGVTWQGAVKWLRDVFCSGQPTEELYRPGQGICTYATGTRPKAGGDYSLFWWPQWSGPLHYRAIMTADEELAAACDHNDELLARWIESRTSSYFGWINSTVPLLPSVWWIRGGGRGSVLHAALRPVLDAMLEKSASENGKPREMDCGVQATIAEALLLGAEAYEVPAMRDQAMVLLREMAERLDGNFWEFNVGRAGSRMHGGQIRSLGHGHAIVANLLACRLCEAPLPQPSSGGRGSQFLTNARRFARYLLAVNYATHNGSKDPDFDWRGWCNGSNAGRDQIAECPPWETQNGLLCMAALMDATELEAGFYDVLWYIARTGLAQFPAARTVKRILDETMQVHYVPREKIASERDFYDTLPYLAYENPHDQTLLASYQGSDCLLGEFVYGGGLARSSDPRLGVLVPRAATLDLRELTERHIHVWNPTPKPIRARIVAAWTEGSTTQQLVTAPPRQLLRVALRNPSSNRGTHGEGQAVAGTS
jgi:hypothetical protein